MPPIQPLKGKAAIVTGGARRIGRAIALALARAGADVAITYLESEAEATLTVKAIEALGSRAQAIRCDVRSEDSVREMIASAAAHHGRIDILVNNAAVFESAPLDQISLDEWDRVFETNTRGPFLVAREAIAALRSTHGRIINIGSLGGVRPWAGHAHYCASKAALHMLTRAMAKAFAPDVSVNCVAPGWIAMEESNEKEAAHFAAMTPLRRNGTAEDIAEAVLCFAGSSGFITGEILVVDGGLGL
jgi:NAD(P)-dependent dehydrogenase (short-subunit alcohol dehydrogenase family)